jgi:hypothetical protein
MISTTATKTSKSHSKRDWDKKNPNVVKKCFVIRRNVRIFAQIIKSITNYVFH